MIDAAIVPPYRLVLGSRRAMLGATLGAVAHWGLRRLDGRGAPRTSNFLNAPTNLWLLTSPSELRPAAPSAPTPAEVEELRALQATRSRRAIATAAKWTRGSAVLPWTSLALDLIKTHKPSPVRAGRALALLHVALADTLVAVADAQNAFIRPAPIAIVDDLAPLPDNAISSGSYPSAHAAIAGAATTVLGYLFPDEPAPRLAALATEATESRLAAGAAFRSDIEIGMALGRAVGERAVARGRGDGSARAWNGQNQPTTMDHWRPTPPNFRPDPLDPLAGTWQPWLIASGDESRPAPPPAWGTRGWHAELTAVRAAVARRTPEQEAAVHFWAGGPGSVTPAGLWIEIARDLIEREELDPTQAANVLALTSVAIADAFVCCWDTKYAYWTARPISADPTLDVLIPTPPFPSYTSGHATISAAAATVLGFIFPDEAEVLAARAIEAKDSRLWAGIHFPLDNEVGAAMGGLVGRMVADWAGGAIA